MGIAGPDGHFSSLLFSFLLRGKKLPRNFLGLDALGISETLFSRVVSFPFPPRALDYGGSVAKLRNLSCRDSPISPLGSRP